MNLVNRNSALWTFASDNVKGLIFDGELVLEDAEKDPKRISDYSYVVFPFAKAYEGFLKTLFLHLKLIKEDEYYGDDIRIGKILNPNYLHEHQNVFKSLSLSVNGEDSHAERMWEIWRKGRNQVFHYFPHNFRKLSIDEAKEIIQELLDVMEIAVQHCYTEK